MTKEEEFEQELRAALKQFSEAGVTGANRAHEIIEVAIVAREGRPTFAIAGAFAFVGLAVVVGLGFTSWFSSLPLPPSAGTSSSQANDQVLYSCDGHTFAISLFNESAVDLTASAEGRAVQDLVRSSEHRGNLPLVGWHIAGTDGSITTFVAQRSPSPPFAEIRVSDQGTPHVVSFGPCSPHAVVDGLAVATWNLAPGETLTPETTSFWVDAFPLECGGGQATNPIVRYESDRVIVIVVMAPVTAGEHSFCIANPPKRIRIDLLEPIGGRSMWDGAQLPLRRSSR